MKRFLYDSTTKSPGRLCGADTQRSHSGKKLTEGMSQADFLEDSKTQDAVIMKLLVIGELAAQLLEEHNEFTGTHPEIPWHQMKGMRNRMAHGYFELNMDVVWDTVQLALPDLEANLRLITR